MYVFITPLFIILGGFIFFALSIFTIGFCAGLVALMESVKELIERFIEWG